MSARAIAAARQRLSRRLRALPAHRAVFERCLDALIAARPLGIGMFGSLSRGAVDRWSDLDWALVCADRRGLAPLVRRATKAMAGAIEEVTRWSSDGADDKQTALLCREGDESVRVDIHVVTLARYARGPRCTALFDPRGRLAATRVDTRRQPAYYADRDAHQTAALSLLWETRVRLERHDVLEAVATLTNARNYLLPCICASERIAWHGWRNLDQRLPSARVRALRATWPRSLRAADVRRALDASVRLLRRSLTPDSQPIDAMLRDLLRP